MVKVRVAVVHGVRDSNGEEGVTVSACKASPFGTAAGLGAAYDILSCAASDAIHFTV